MTYPSLAGCAKAALTVALTVGTAGEGEVAEIGLNAAEHAGEDLAENAGAHAAEDAVTFYHGTSLDSARGLLENPALDAGKAAAGHMDGPSGFHLATESADAEYFALRCGQGAILRYDISSRGVQALRDAGATLRDIPGRPPPFFLGQEFHVPASAFSKFNDLLGSGDIRVGPA